MGAKAKTAAKKQVKKGSKQLAISRQPNDAKDFLPLEGGPLRKIPVKEEPVKDTCTVLYIGHIPHGFYEDQMEGFFKQFGAIKRLRIARNKKTGKSKHYGFIEFVNPEVAKVVADEIDGYLVFEHSLQIHLIPPERLHPKLYLCFWGIGGPESIHLLDYFGFCSKLIPISRWKGVNRKSRPFDYREYARKQHNKERTLEEHQRMVEGILKRDEKRRKRLEAAGIDYECPEFVGNAQPAPKKIKFDDDDDDDEE